MFVQFVGYFISYLRSDFFIRKLILFVYFKIFNHINQSLFIVVIVWSHSLLWYGHSKTSILTQRWIHYYISMIYYLNEFIITVLCSFSCWVLSHIIHDQEHSYKNSYLWLIIYTFYWINKPFFIVTIARSHNLFGTTNPKHQV